MPDEVELAGVVVEAEEDRPDLVAVLVYPVAADDAVDRPAVLDLDHRPLAVDVGLVERLGDDPVAACRLEFVEPPHRLLDIGG